MCGASRRRTWPQCGHKGALCEEASGSLGWSQAGGGEPPGRKGVGGTGCACWSRASAAARGTRGPGGGRPLDHSGTPSPGLGRTGGWIPILGVVRACGQRWTPRVQQGCGSWWSRGTFRLPCLVLSEESGCDSTLELARLPEGAVHLCLRPRVLSWAPRYTPGSSAWLSAPLPLSRGVPERPVPQTPRALPPRLAAVTLGCVGSGQALPWLPGDVASSSGDKAPMTPTLSTGSGTDTGSTQCGRWELPGCRRRPGETAAIVPLSEGSI